MAYTIRRADYFYAAVDDHPGEAYELLSQLAGQGVNLIAITALPTGPMRTQLTLFPQDPARMRNAAQKAGIALDGPHRALLVQGDDEVGVLARLHSKLHHANVDMYASSGVTDGRGGYGHVIYVGPEHFEKAAQARFRRGAGWRGATSGGSARYPGRSSASSRRIGGTPRHRWHGRGSRS